MRRPSGGDDALDDRVHGAIGAEAKARALEPPLLLDEDLAVVVDHDLGHLVVLEKLLERSEAHRLVEDVALELAAIERVGQLILERGDDAADQLDRFGAQLRIGHAVDVLAPKVHLVEELLVDDTAPVGELLVRPGIDGGLRTEAVARVVGGNDERTGRGLGVRHRRRASAEPGRLLTLSPHARGATLVRRLGRGARHRGACLPGALRRSGIVRARLPVRTVGTEFVASVDLTPARRLTALAARRTEAERAQNRATRATRERVRSRLGRARRQMRVDGAHALPALLARHRYAVDDDADIADGDLVQIAQRAVLEHPLPVHPAAAERAEIADVHAVRLQP